MKRRFSIIAVVLVMVMLVAVPAALASGTEYRALTVPEVTAPQADPVKLGSLYVRVTPLEAGTHTALVALPAGFTLVKPGDLHALESPAMTMAFSATGKAYEFRMSVSIGAAYQAATFVIPVVAA